MACSSAHRDQTSTEGDVIASYSPILLDENRKELLPLRFVSRTKSREERCFCAVQWTGGRRQSCRDVECISN